MARIALKVDVDTLRGTREGVPELARIFDQARTRATFLFSLGPDHTGWALKRIFRPGFLKKVSRTSVVEHYGLKTLSYGVLLPAPDIGIKAQAEIQAIGKAGHETGIHTWDHIVWHDDVRHQDETWTRKQMGLSWGRFEEIFKHPPTTHGAAGWQMNNFALQQLDDWGMTYASDGRAEPNLIPYRVELNGQASKHVQYPTTLPTFDELLGVNEMDAKDSVAHLLRITANNPNDQVFTLHAELEGQKLSEAFKLLLQGWLDQGHDLVSMAELHQSYQATGQLSKLAVLPLKWGTVPNRSGELMVMT